MMYRHRVPEEWENVVNKIIITMMADVDFYIRLYAVGEEERRKILGLIAEELTNRIQPKEETDEDARHV